MKIHMADGFLHTLCRKTYYRIFHNLETWTTDEDEVNCSSCLQYLREIRKNKLYNF